MSLVITDINRNKSERNKERNVSWDLSLRECIDIINCHSFDHNENNDEEKIAFYWLTLNLDVIVLVMLQLDLHLVDIDAVVSMLHGGYRVVHGLDSIRPPGCTTGVNWPLLKKPGLISFWAHSFCVVKFLCVLINQITDCVTGKNVFNNWMLSLFDCQSNNKLFKSFHPFASPNQRWLDSSLDLQGAVKKAIRLAQRKVFQIPCFKLSFDAENPSQLFRPPSDLWPEKLRLLINSFKEREPEVFLGIANTSGDLLQQRTVLLPC